jgi:hypothetical protein
LCHGIPLFWLGRSAVLVRAIRCSGDRSAALASHLGRGLEIGTDTGEGTLSPGVVTVDRIVCIPSNEHNFRPEVLVGFSSGDFR